METGVLPGGNKTLASLLCLLQWLNIYKALILVAPNKWFRVFNLPVYFSSLLEIKVTRPLTFHTRFSNNIITMLDCPDHTEKSGKKFGQVYVGIALLNERSVTPYKRGWVKVF